MVCDDEDNVDGVDCEDDDVNVVHLNKAYYQSHIASRRYETQAKMFFSSSE